MNADHRPLVLGPDFLHDPHPCYAAMRRDRSVTEAVLATGLRAWLTTRCADARTVLPDPTLSKDEHVAKELFDRHVDPARTAAHFP